MMRSILRVLAALGFIASILGIMLFVLTLFIKYPIIILSASALFLGWALMAFLHSIGEELIG